MESNRERLSLLVLPDPVTKPETLSGAVFLYFEEPLWFSIPPVVLTQDSYQLLTLIEQRKPDWGPAFWGLFNLWRQQHDGSRKTIDTIAPLKEKYKTLYLSYACGLDALESSNTLITSAGFSLDSVIDIIDPFHASGEIIRHIMLETFLELGGEIEALYKYCANLFKVEPIPHLLAKGYFLRVQILAKMRQGPVLLTNERLCQFLDNLPVETEAQAREDIDIDVIAWELFRQILSPRLDPLNAERAKFIAELLKSRKEEIERLRLRCQELANQVRQPKTLQDLPKRIDWLVRTHVEKEIAELLQLNKKALEAFLTSVFSDDKTWFAILAFISGVATGHTYVTTGGAITALSSIGAKAFKAAADRRQKLKQNDYALVYTISRRSS